MHINVIMGDWRSLSPPLSQHCLEVLKDLCFATPTPVQTATIPHFMSNKDVAVEAATGSGKTLAFVIPIVEALMKRPESWGAGKTSAVIITPTRELASQIAVVLSSFLPHHLHLALLIGGSDVTADVSTINERGAHVVVATPGRLLALLSQGDCLLASHVRALETLVLDEADRLLEMGFEQSVSSILRYLPKQRRTGLFSATLTVDVKLLVKAGLRHPVTITIQEKGQREGHVATPPALHSYYLECLAGEKLSTLLALLRKFESCKVLVFFATCASVTFFSAITARLLESVPVLSLHGRMHGKRQALFNQFSTMDSGVLMSTDVMARGVDFPAVHWVIQFDPPSSSNFFVHRCGRTARMGQEGHALVLLTASELSYVDFLKLNKGLSLQPYSMPTPLSIVDEARRLVACERELYEQGLRSFVSFVHFYYKHECKFIFQPKALDLVGTAKTFALLHLPKMPELKSVDTSTFDPYPVDPSTIPYHSNAREKQRKMNVRKGVRQRGPAMKEKSKASTRVKNWEKRKRQESRGKKRKQKQMLTDEELEELSRDARLLKKFKSGKISETELDRQLELSSHRS